MTSHWEFLNQVLCEDIVRHVIQPYLLPSVETSIETHKTKWAKVVAEIFRQHRKWQFSRQSHILSYYCHFDKPSDAQLIFYTNHVPIHDLDFHFPKIVEKLPPRLKSLTAYIKEPIDGCLEICVVDEETGEFIRGDQSIKWITSLEPWWWKLRKSYETAAYYLRRARYRLSCC